MAKDPAILFYTSDFLSGTFTLTDEQIGRYIKLLCLQHQKGFLTEKDMLNICKSYDEDIYLKFVNENGKFYNKRMREEIEKRIKYSESRRNNRINKDSSKKDMNNICKSYVEHMENENENINEDIINNKSYIKLFEKVNLEFKLNNEFENLILTWLKYKSEKNQSYKETGLKTLIKGLLKDSNNNIELARDMIENSMKNNYAGIFKVNAKQNNRLKHDTDY